MIKSSPKVDVLLLIPPLPKGVSVQADAVLARCAGVYSKTDYHIPPLGLCYIAGTLRQEGISVSIIDCPAGDISEKEAIERIKCLKPEFILISPGTSALLNDLEFIKNLKESGLKFTSIGCGTHLTVLPEDGLSGGLDYIVRGEPEITTLELIRSLKYDKSVSKVKGISYLKDGNVINNERRELIEDLDTLPLPARDLIGDFHYKPPYSGGGRFTIMTLSRGCPYPCTYCATSSYYGRRVRYRSIENVLSEMREVRKSYDIIGFWDDTFTLKRKYVIEIMKGMVSENLTIPFLCMSRIDTVDREMLTIMKRAGCRLILYGVESASQRVLDILKKKTKIDTVEEVFEMTRGVGIETAGFFMIGTPGETRREIIRTIELAHRLDPDYVSFNITTPYPGTELYKNYKHLFRKWEDFDARHAMDEDGRVLEGYIDRAYRSFYFRLSYILRRLGRTHSREGLSVLFKAGFDVMSRYMFRGILGGVR
ncbi:MAG: B12-binding domain-containing radical SAM protein [bacterium]